MIWFEIITPHPPPPPPDMKSISPALIPDVLHSETLQYSNRLPIPQVLDQTNCQTKIGDRVLSVLTS